MAFISRFRKENLGPNDHLALCTKLGLLYSPAQTRALRALMVWRDKTARQEDESIPYVMPNQTMVSICNSMPTTNEQLLSCTSPIPPLVREHVAELVKLIHHSRDDSSLSMSPPTPLPAAAWSGGGFNLDGQTPNKAKSQEGNAVVAGKAAAPPVESPVLSTDELYQQAGWIGPAGGPERIPGIPVFDMSGMMEMVGASQCD